MVTSKYILMFLCKSKLVDQTFVHLKSFSETAVLFHGLIPAASSTEHGYGHSFAPGHRELSLIHPVGGSTKQNL